MRVVNSCVAGVEVEFRNVELVFANVMLKLAENVDIVSAAEISYM